MPTGNIVQPPAGAAQTAADVEKNGTGLGFHIEIGFVEDEIDTLNALLDSLLTMSGGRWDENLPPHEFGAIMRTIRQQGERAAVAAQRLQGSA